MSPIITYEPLEGLVSNFGWGIPYAVGFLGNETIINWQTQIRQNIIKNPLKLN